MIENRPSSGFVVTVKMRQFSFPNVVHFKQITSWDIFAEQSRVETLFFFFFFFKTNYELRKSDFSCVYYRIVRRSRIEEVSGKYMFLISPRNICCDYSLEAPQQGASNEYPQHTFSWRNRNKYACVLSYLELYIVMQNIVDDILKYFSEKVRPVIWGKPFAKQTIRL